MKHKMKYTQINTREMFDQKETKEDIENDLFDPIE